MKYNKEYYKTDEWAEKREVALDNAANKCQVCSNPKSLNVHHNTYDRFGGDELDTDLVVLCNKCHRLFHGISRTGKKKKKSKRGKLYRGRDRQIPTICLYCGESILFFERPVGRGFCSQYCQEMSKGL